MSRLRSVFRWLKPPDSRAGRWLAVAAVGSVLVGTAAAVEWWRTRRAYRQGVEALTAGDAGAAVEQFQRAVPIWGTTAELAFRSAQAARRADDSAAAIGYLIDAERLGRSSVDTDAERALIAVRNGVPFGRLEAALRSGLEADPVTARDAVAALADGYVGQFRITEAEAATAVWVERWPDDAAAWQRRADVLERLVRSAAARDAYARWAALAPHDRRARLGLVRLLFATQSSLDEVVAQLDRLEADGATEPEYFRFKARAQVAGGRADDAAATLDRAAAGPTPDGRVLTDRARLDLDRGRATTAVAFARRAVAVDPSDVEALYTLVRCLHQTGPAAEAAEVEARWKRTAADLQRVNELGQKISAAPFDPDLRCEIGELFLRHGRDSDGLRWLQSALAIRPDHERSRQILTDYYAKVGRKESNGLRRDR